MRNQVLPPEWAWSYSGGEETCNRTTKKKHSWDLVCSWSDLSLEPRHWGEVLPLGPPGLTVVLHPTCHGAENMSSVGQLWNIIMSFANRNVSHGTEHLCHRYWWIDPVGMKKNACKYSLTLSAIDAIPNYVPQVGPEKTLLVFLGTMNAPQWWQHSCSPTPWDSTTMHDRRQQHFPFGICSFVSEEWGEGGQNSRFCSSWGAAQPH